MRRYVLVHGGTGSKPRRRDGTDAAAEAGWRSLARGDALDAAVAAVASLEKDPRFNAGKGAAFRLDGKTIEMDAACMDSTGRYGGVTCIERVQHPVLVARELVGLPQDFLCGAAATAFARRHGRPDFDPATPKARRQWRHVVRALRSGKASRTESEWDLANLERHWNYDTPFEDVFRRMGSVRSPVRFSGMADTVGAVASDGKTFAVAASTGGTIASLRGRIGDTPSPGAGLYASPRGAVAATGIGDHFLRQHLCARVDSWLRGRGTPLRAIEQAVALFPGWVDVGLVVATRKGYAAGGNTEFACSVADEGEVSNPTVHVYEPREDGREVQEPPPGREVPLQRRPPVRKTKEVKARRR